MRRVLAWSCLAAFLIVAAAIAPAAAGAAASAGVEGEFYDRVSQGSGPVSGALNDIAFAAQGDALVATGTAAVSLCFPGVDPKNCVASYDFAVMTTVASVSGTCDAIVVEFGAIEGLVGDRFEIDLHAVTPLVGTEDRRHLRCAIARKAQSGKALKALARLLNRL